jgi:hypothetical protein
MGRLNPKATSRNTGWQMLYPGVGPDFPIVKNNLAVATEMDSVIIPGGTLKVGDLIRIRGVAGSRATSGTPAAYAFRSTIGPTFGGGSQIASTNLTPATPTAIRFCQESLVTSSTTLMTLSNGWTGYEENTVENIGSYPTGFVTTLSSGSIATEQTIFLVAVFADVLQECRLHWWTVEVLVP